MPCQHNGRAAKACGSAVFLGAGTLRAVRIARFTTGDEPRFAVVGEDQTGEIVLAVVEGDPLYRPIRLTGEKVALVDARLVAPVIPRSKVVGVGRNYAEHAAELGNEVPTEPLLFLKPNTSVIGPGEPIVLPRQSHEVHHEAELAVVIGRVCREVPPVPSWTPTRRRGRASAWRARARSPF